MLVNERKRKITIHIWSSATIHSTIALIKVSQEYARVGSVGSSWLASRPPFTLWYSSTWSWKDFAMIGILNWFQPLIHGSKCSLQRWVRKTVVPVLEPYVWTTKAGLTACFCLAEHYQMVLIVYSDKMTLAKQTNMLSSFILLEKRPYVPCLEFLNFINLMLLLMLWTEGAMSPCTWCIAGMSDNSSSSGGTLSWVCMCLWGSMTQSHVHLSGFKVMCINCRAALLVSFVPIELWMGWAWRGKHFSTNRWRGAWQIKTYVCSYRLRGSCQKWVLIINVHMVCRPQKGLVRNGHEFLISLL